MDHAVDDPPTDHRPSALTSVLAVGLSDTDSVKIYMEWQTKSGGGPVQRVYKLVYSTYIVDFHNHADAVKVLRRDHHSIRGWQACMFLYDKDRKTVYSGHQTVSCQDEGRKQVEHLPRVDLQAPTTVIVTGVPYVSGVTADDIKARMEMLKNVRCSVKSVQCLAPVHIAIVEFQRSEDAMRVGNMEQVTVPGEGKEWPVRVFVLLPLPSDPADIPNTAQTAIAGMPVAASAARVGQTQALERNQEPGAPVTPPHDSRTMQAGITAGSSCDEGTFQKEKSRVQDKTEKTRRLKDQLEELRRAKNQLEAQMKAQVTDKAKMQSDVSRLEARLREVDAVITQLHADMQTHQRQCQKDHTQHERQCHTQHEAHQRQCQADQTKYEVHQRWCTEQIETHIPLTMRIAANKQNSLVMAATIGTLLGQLHPVNQKVQAIQGQLRRLLGQGVGHGVAQIRGPCLEVTNPSDVE